MAGLKNPQSARLPGQPQPALMLRIGFWACTAIAIAVVIRRIFALLDPPRSAPPQLAALDAVFASHAALTLAHILPALVFVLIAPLVIFRRPANAVWPERLIFPVGGSRRPHRVRDEHLPGRRMGRALGCLVL